MSLTVPPVLLEQARAGEVDDAEFLDCVRTSLPYAWDVVTGLVKELKASDAMRDAIERCFGVRLAFQNCHRAAVFRPAATAAIAAFTSPRAQLLNQRPELVNC